MIEVEPMEGELAAAHAARWMHVLGCRSYDELHTHLRAELPAEVRGSPLLHCIALACGLSPTEYSQRHSMLGILQVATTNQCSGHEDLVQESGAESVTGLEVPRKRGYVCPRCLEEDLAENLISWFRRNHQLVGVDWCTTHGDALLPVLAKKPYEQSPHLLRREKLLGEPEVATRLPMEGFARRFVKVSVGLLGSARPASCSRLHGLIADYAERNGVGGDTWRNRRLLSDLVLESADERWLLRHVPQFHHKIRGGVFRRIDKIIGQTAEPAEGDSYALALAALFPSTAEALEVVARARETRPSASSLQP